MLNLNYDSVLRSYACVSHDKIFCMQGNLQLFVEEY